MDDLIPSETIGSLLPLLSRANNAAKALSKRRYDNEEQWSAEVKIAMKHGLTHFERLSDRFLNREIPVERFTVTVQIRAYMSSRYFTLEEAELIISNFEKNP